MKRLLSRIASWFAEDAIRQRIDAAREEGFAAGRASWHPIEVSAYIDFSPNVMRLSGQDVSLLERRCEDDVMARVRGAIPCSISKDNIITAQGPVVRVSACAWIMQERTSTF
jgi:hypothetical protein